MDKKYHLKRLIVLLASAMLLITETGIFAYTWFYSYAYTGALERPFFYMGNLAVIALYALMLMLFFQLTRSFRVGHLRIFEVLFTQILSLCCVNAITYVQLCLIGHWKFWTHMEPVIWMTVVDSAFVFVWVVFNRWIVTKVYPPRDLLLIYGPYSPDSLIHKIQGREDKYEIREIISYEEDIELIKERILHYRCVVITDLPPEIRNNVLKFCYANDVRCYAVPKISDIMIMAAQDTHLFDTSMLLFRNKGLSIAQRAVKRVFDIVVSLIALLVFSPFMIIIAILIKCYDGGPVIYGQDRLTRGGKVFKVLKFRSMRVQQGSDQYCMTRKNDDRITPVGKIIRAIHFDELPQLFNILRGEMSVVGPRPETPELAAEYKENIPEFDFRLKVKAGLTGFAQVYGKYNTTPYDKLKLDLTYIENYSFWLDLKLMVMTFEILFARDNTEGIESWQTHAELKKKQTSGKK